MTLGADPTSRPEPVFLGEAEASPPLLRVERGGHLESLHRGAVVVVEGVRPVLVRGPGEAYAYYRSTSKPLQALVGITSGAADAFGLTPEELALAAGSHSSRPEHIRAARSILTKAGVGEAALRCGAHPAFDPEVRFRQQVSGDRLEPIVSNCSGKHALMLATARHLRVPIDTYVDPGHPVQQEIRGHLARFGDLAPTDVMVGRDGCGVPTFAVPLRSMALSLARLGRPDGLPRELARASRRVQQAMRAHPAMVGGPGRFDTDLMQMSGGRLVAKAGAEGLHGVAVPDRGIGIIVAAEDGSDRGYRLVVLEILRRLGLLGADAFQVIAARHADPVVRTLTGEAVGRLCPVLDD